LNVQIFQCLELQSLLHIECARPAKLLLQTGLQINSTSKIVSHLNIENEKGKQR
jgi:hypothetical protein